MLDWHAGVNGFWRPFYNFFENGEDLFKTAKNARKSPDFCQFIIAKTLDLR